MNRCELASHRTPTVVGNFIKKIRKKEEDRHLLTKTQVEVECVRLGILHFLI